jgi:hypothetical protein
VNAAGPHRRREAPPGQEPLVEYLERDQLVADTSRPVPRRSLGPWERAGLWILRVAFLLLGAMVIYVFVAQLG